MLDEGITWLELLALALGDDLSIYTKLVRSSLKDKKTEWQVNK